jgi:Mg2+ and Co2+ transporter CorA
VINNVSPGATLNFSSVNRFGQAGSKEADTEALDAVALLDRLAQLEGRLGEAAKTVNEEIQLFIASVSIRDSEVMLADSKIMREDSQIMKQQAARTTLLTTLAVIYLPLQLITGIFGMNIQEITADGSLRWWACLAALGVGGVLTCLVYLAVKWWQWRRSQRKAREGEKEKEA